MAPRRRFDGDVVSRYAGIGAVSAGAVGAVVGLVIGLIVHPATAWFAIIEVGVPAGLVGLLIGAVTGVIVAIARHVGALRARR